MGWTVKIDLERFKIEVCARRRVLEGRLCGFGVVGD